MATKSPTTSVKSREIIGVDQFSQRREVFDKHDTVFMPLPSPTSTMPAYKDVEPIITSNHGKTTSNFKRNAATYSSMRETRNEDRNIEFRPRKYSDNFTSELSQGDDVDYRYSMTERTRRISKLRRDFLKSNLHEPGTDSPFARNGTRASMPTGSTVIRYKIESPNLYKFPFAEPYATPPPVRRVVVDLGPPEVNGEKENQDPEARPIKHYSMPNNEKSLKVNHQKLFEELVKRYSPQRKPIDWTLPPTRPRVVGSVPKSTSSVADSIDSADRKTYEVNLDKTGDDDVFVKKKNIEHVVDVNVKVNDCGQEPRERAEENTVITQNGPDDITELENKKERESKTSLEEKNDKVPELSSLQTLHSLEPSKNPSLEKFSDLTIPNLLDKMADEADNLEKRKKDQKKVKRKRSFWDKLLGKKKEK